MKIWNKIKCWLDQHEDIVFDVAYIEGLLTGDKVQATRWACKHCGKISNFRTVTETIGHFKIGNGK